MFWNRFGGQFGKLIHNGIKKSLQFETPNRTTWHLDIDSHFRNRGDFGLTLPGSLQESQGRSQPCHLLVTWPFLSCVTPFVCDMNMVSHHPLHWSPGQFFPLPGSEEAPQWICVAWLFGVRLIWYAVVGIFTSCISSKKIIPGMEQYVVVCHCMSMHRKWIRVQRPLLTAKDAAFKRLNTCLAVWKWKVEPPKAGSSANI